MCALFWVAAWAGSAAASVLYRCTASSGQTAYVSHTAGYRGCVKIGEWHTPVVHAVPVAYKPKSSTGKSHSAAVLPGKPPQPVSANPSVLKVTPLGDDGAVTVAHPQSLNAWQPFPVVAMDTLASWVLPRVLGVELAPAGPAASAPAKGVGPAPSTSTGNPRASNPAPQHVVIAAKPASARIDAQATPVPPPRHGAVYRVVEKNGTVMYTNVASLAHGHPAKMLFTYIIECYACNVHSKVDWDTVPLRLTAYGNDIAAASKMTGVDAALLRAIIHAESGFNPRALSYKGAQGLMQ
ncbi:MAG TPA: transglycosylase SLT domain-containing protein, partial [Rhodanobacteraceae bacterium]